VGDPDLTRALVLADEPPFIPLDRLLARPVDIVLCLGDLGQHDLEPLGRAGVPKLGVHGNHDDGREFTGLGIEDVHLRRVEIDGLSFGGFSGSHEYHRELPFTWSQKEASKLLAKFGHVDVMLAHSPAYGVNDERDDPAHTGLIGLLEYLQRERPAMFLHGHTYPPLPVDRFGATAVRHVRGHRYVVLPSPA
jgi:uncharacterized protein